MKKNTNSGLFLVSYSVILIAFGGNLISPLGGPIETIMAAAEHLKARKIEALEMSCWYETRPVPYTGQPNFINTVATARTVLSPSELLSLFKETEVLLGRVPGERWSARTIDIDLLAYGTAVLPDKESWWRVVKDVDPAAILEQPVVPHPRLHKRAFVLRPLMDVAPDWHHPVLKQSVKDMCTEEIVQAQWVTVVKKTV